MLDGGILWATCRTGGWLMRGRWLKRLGGTLSHAGFPDPAGPGNELGPR